MVRISAAVGLLIVGLIGMPVASADLIDVVECFVEFNVTAGQTCADQGAENERPQMVPDPYTDGMVCEPLPPPFLLAQICAYGSAGWAEDKSGATCRNEGVAEDGSRCLGINGAHGGYLQGFGLGLLSGRATGELDNDLTAECIIPEKQTQCGGPLLENDNSPGTHWHGHEVCAPIDHTGSADAQAFNGLLGTGSVLGERAISNFGIKFEWTGC